MAKSRGYTFTLNNYTDDDIKNIQEFKCEYLFQEETGEKGTKHLQGMLYYKNPVSFNTIKKLLPRAHIERMKNRIASIRYCSKKETRTGQMYTNIEDAEQYRTDGTEQKMVKSLKKSSKKNIDDQARNYMRTTKELMDIFFDDWCEKRYEVIPEDILQEYQLMSGLELEGGGQYV